MFFSLAKGYLTPTASQLRDLSLRLEELKEINVVKTMYAVYQLTADDTKHYVSAEAIAESAGLTFQQTEAALKKLSVTVKEEQDTLFYRLKESCVCVLGILTLL